MIRHPRILALFGSAALFGQERGNIEALAALKDQGCEILCLVRDEAWSDQITPALDARGLSWLKVPYIEHRLPGRLHYIVFRNPIAFLRANWRFVSISRNFRPTHVHAFNQLYVLNFLVGLTMCRWPMVFRAGDEPTVHNLAWRAIWKFVVWRTDKFVANSEFVARSLIANSVSAARIVVIYNSPPKRTGATEEFTQLNTVDTAKYITYVGQVSEHKGVEVLIDAFKILAQEFIDAQLVIAGRISDWSGDAWARRLRDGAVNDRLLRDRVVFLGEVADVPGLLSRSHVHVAPSLFDDPSPNVVMESKLAARPSVVFSRGGMPELVEDGVDGRICQQTTAESLADAIRSYLANPELSTQHGLAAFRSLRRFGIGEFAQRWREVYEYAARDDRVRVAVTDGN